MEYLWNCFWLTLPILLVNLLFATRLPATYQSAVFWCDTPRWIAVGENASRIVVFVAPLFMPLYIANSVQLAGLALYLVGLLVYVLAWVMQIWYVQTRWSSSRLGFMAPAYSPAFWLAGMALISERLYFGKIYRPWMFLVISTVFLAFHNAHAWNVYSRSHRH